MNLRKTRISDVLVFEPSVFEDDRGTFHETFRQNWFDELGVQFVQDNHSRSRRNVVRGLHYQVNQPQGKLVRVIRGEVLDVAVDLRVNSPTFAHWVGEILSDTNHHVMWIPSGFAHGFAVLSDVAEFSYKCTDYYAPENERCIRFDDPTLAIDWLVSGDIVASPKDRSGLDFRSAEYFK